MKKFTFLIILISLALKSTGQTDDGKLTYCYLTPEEFKPIAQTCLDSIFLINASNPYQYRLLHEIRVPGNHLSNAVIIEDIFIKPFLNFQISDLNLSVNEPPEDIINAKEIDLYFCWPMINVNSGNLIICIEQFRGLNLTTHYFSFTRKKGKSVISDYWWSFGQLHKQVDFSKPYPIMSKEQIDTNRKKMKEFTKKLKTLPEPPHQ